MKHISVSASVKHDKRLFDYFLAEVFIDNGLLGTQFIFHVNDCDALQLPKMFARRLRSLHQIDRHNGLYIRPLLTDKEGELSYGVSEAYLALLRHSPTFVNHLISPLLATVLFGQYKGLQFSLFGTKEITRYFSLPAIQRAVRGTRGFHRSCFFERVSHREAIPFYGKLTEEVYQDLLIHNRLKKH